MTLQREREVDGGSVPLAALATNGYTNGHHPAAHLSVSVVIPARNEAQSLPHVLGKLPPWVHEVILVDGLSVDDTSRVAKSELPAIRIIEQTGRGKGNALREGFFHCTGDIVVAIDADGSMDPGEMSRYVRLVAEGYDYVKGSRMLPGGASADLTRLRSLGNWMFRTLTNVLTGSRYSDLCYGYFAFRRGTIDALDLRSDGFEIETEINIRAHRAGLRIAEVPSIEALRRHGASQLHAFKDGLRILFTIAKSSFGRKRRIEPAIGLLTDGESMTPAAISVPLEDEKRNGHNGLPPDYH